MTTESTTASPTTTTKEALERVQSERVTLTARRATLEEDYLRVLESDITGASTMVSRADLTKQIAELDDTRSRLDAVEKRLEARARHEKATERLQTYDEEVRASSDAARRLVEKLFPELDKLVARTAQVKEEIGEALSAMLTVDTYDCPNLDALDSLLRNFNPLPRFEDLFERRLRTARVIHGEVVDAGGIASNRRVDALTPWATEFLPKLLALFERHRPHAPATATTTIEEKS